MANNLAEQWKEKKVEFPKTPFAYITVYQNLVPITFLLLLDVFFIFLILILQIPVGMQIILFPGIILSNYFLYIVSLSICSKWLNSYYEYKSPPQQGTFVREFEKGDVGSSLIHYYHLRGFLYKWPVWVAKKSIFPWRLNYVLRRANKIDKDFMYGDAYVGLELNDLRKNAVVMEGAVLSSHVVDSLYGNLTIKQVIVEEGGVILPNGIAAPGVIVGENMVLGPNTYAPKDWAVLPSEQKMRWGVPPTKKGYLSFTDLLPEDLKKSWEEKSKNSKKKL